MTEHFEHEMKTSLESYRQSRDALLEQIASELSHDERFVAAWLTGSYGRNDADEVSDVDLRLVVAPAYSASLCARQEQVSPRTTSERLALFSRFGKPALIHENNNNAPEGGTFTFVLYAGSALMVDWTLIPQNQAERPFQTLLLFEKQAIPLATAPEPEEPGRAKKIVAEQWAFFWMMAAVTVKYIVRGDVVFVTEWLEQLHRMVQEIERHLRREPWTYSRGSLSRLQSTPEKQVESIRSLCQRMQALASQVEQFTGRAPVAPLGEIETLLALALPGEDHASH